MASIKENDKLFEIHERPDYYMKDALDKKHGYYFLRVGSEQTDSDLNLKVRMFVEGDKLETSETDEKLSILKMKEGGKFRLSTTCKIRPE